MTGDQTGSAGEGALAKPPKIKANDNPWYLLATLYGEPADAPNDAQSRERHDRNRVAWNRYFSVNLDVETRARLIQEKRHPEVELTPFSLVELDEIAQHFEARCNTVDVVKSLPEASATIDFENFEFEQEVVFCGYVFTQRVYFINATFSGVADFGRATFRRDVIFAGATFCCGANFQSATFFGWAAFSSAKFSRWAIFTSVAVSNTAEFVSATFSQGASFKEAKLSGGANFARAVSELGESNWDSRIG
jgi:hypothetical protein